MRRVSVETTWHGLPAHELQGHLGPAPRPGQDAPATGGTVCLQIPTFRDWFECNFSYTACRQADGTRQAGRKLFLGSLDNVRLAKNDES